MMHYHADEEGPEMNHFGYQIRSLLPCTLTSSLLL